MLDPSRCCAALTSLVVPLVTGLEGRKRSLQEAEAGEILITWAAVRTDHTKATCCLIRMVLRRKAGHAATHWPEELFDLFVSSRGDMWEAG